MSLAAAKYITKYTHKGPDRATVEITQCNEVSEFRDSRYIAATEATWRLFEFPIHHQQPPIISLQVHLPGQHMVVFKPNKSVCDITLHAQQQYTMLSAFFELNMNDTDARIYTYQQIPLHYVWDSNKKLWKRRQKGGSIGHLYFVSPIAGERFYLRLLLTTVKGPTTWEDLCTFDDIIHPTFHVACLAHGLLQSNDKWRQCLLEASSTHLGEKLHCLFSLILRHCEPSQPDLLWEEFHNNLCNDLGYRLGKSHPAHTVFSAEEIFDYGLFLINQDLNHNGTSLLSFPSMPRIQRQWDDYHENPYIIEQLAYNVDEQLHLAEQSIPMLNAEQFDAFNKIYMSTCDKSGHTFFLHGPSGMEKMFVYKTLCHHV